MYSRSIEKSVNSYFQRSFVWICHVLCLSFLVSSTLSCSSDCVVTLSQDDILKTNKYDVVRIIAHRGFWKADDKTPSTNSIASLRFAQEYNLWGCEFDVQMTADSIPIVYHDVSIGKVSIAENPLSSLSCFRLPNGEPIPTLEQYLSAAAENNDIVLVMDLKSQSSLTKNMILVDKSLELLAKFKLLSADRVIFISVNTDICKRIAQLQPGLKVQVLFSNISLVDLKEMGMSGIDYYQDLLLRDPSIINQAHNLQLEVNVWPVNDKAKMNSLVNYGVDYITTDDPLALRSVLIGHNNR